MSAHAEFLRKESKDHALVKAIKSDPKNAPLEPQDRALVNFCIKLTEIPSDMQKADAETLKAAGFTEEQVVDIVVITSLFNFMNRLADGLGVELDPMLKMLVDKHKNL